MKLTLINKKEETTDVVSFIFKPDTDITWQAGQFLHYTLPHADVDDRQTERYFTIASAPHEKQVMFTTRFACLASPSSARFAEALTRRARRGGTNKSSSFKKALFKMQVGDVIEADGLEGDFIFMEPEKSHVFIAGGIGITPYRSILLDLDHKNLPINVTLLYANRDKNNVVYQKELEALSAKYPNFKIHYFFDPKRIDEAAIKNIVHDITKPIFYVSGPEPMTEHFQAMLPQMGIPEANIKKDYFPGYSWP